MMKRILMIATGGTIASKSSEAGLKPLITSDELLSYVPDTREFCQADTLQLINIDRHLLFALPIFISPLI